MPSDHVTVERWAEYPGSIVPFVTNKAQAYLDKITWKYIGQSVDRALDLESGVIDSLRGPAPQDVARLKATPGIAISESPELSYYFLGLNFDNPAFADLRVRQAVAHCIDREAIVQKLAFGYGVADYGPLPPSDPNYNKEVEKYNQYDVSEAKSLLAQAGWKPGSNGIVHKGGKQLSFSLVVTNDSFSVELATVIQAMLRNIGLEANIKSYDQATWYTLVGSKAGVDSFIYYALWPFPMDVYIQFAASTSIGLSNWMHCHLPEVDNSIRGYQKAATAAELAAASRAAQLVGAQQLPYVPIFTRSSLYAHRTTVQNYMVIPWDLYPYYNDVWLDS